MGEEKRQEVRRVSDPASLALYEQQRKLEENRNLLEEVRMKCLFPEQKHDHVKQS